MADGSDEMEWTKGAEGMIDGGNEREAGEEREEVSTRMCMEKLQ